MKDTWHTTFSIVKIIYIRPQKFSMQGKYDAADVICMVVDMNEFSYLPHDLGIIYFNPSW